jgi:hypothetical protein
VTIIATGQHSDFSASSSMKHGDDIYSIMLSPLRLRSRMMLYGDDISGYLHMGIQTMLGRRTPRQDHNDGEL